MAIKKWIGTDGSYSAIGNWLPSGVPVNGDTVRLPPGGGAISSGLNQSAVALAAFIVEEGYTAAIGSAALGYLQIGTSRFEFAGGGVAWIDFGSSALDPQVTATAQPTTGNFGLYLKGSAIDDLSVSGSSSVGLAVNAGETATVDDVNVTGAASSVSLGAGVTATTLKISAGKLAVKCAATTVEVRGGTLTTSEVGAVTTMNIYDGTIISNSTGTITTLNLRGGTTKMRGSGALRTVTTTNLYAGATLEADPAVITFTNKPVLQEPMSLSTSA